MNVIGSKINALYIKAKLIDYLLTKDTKSIIGSEIMYGNKKKLVDILELSNNRTFVYEIKASNDDFRKLPNQVSEYKKVFDYIYIVITPNHLSKIDVYLEKENIGIILIGLNDDISVIKKARLQHFNNKEELLHTMNANYLKTKFKINPKIDANQTRLLVSKKSILSIKTTLYQYLHQQIDPRFKLFLNEKGDETLIDDIAILSLSRKKLFR